MTVYVPNATGNPDVDEPAIQQAINAAMGPNSSVTLGLGTYRARSLSLGSASSFHSVSLRGQGALATVLEDVGPDTGTFLLINRNKHSSLESLAVKRALGRGSRSGIEVGGAEGCPGGTQSGSGIWEQVNVSGFHWGVRIGRGAIAASEMTFRHLAVNSCDVGVHGEAYNSLNLVFEMFMPGSCGVGLEANGAGKVYVKSGAAYSNGCDLKLLTGGGYSIADFYSEGSGQMAYVASTTAHTPCRIEGCHFNPDQPFDGYAVVGGWGAELVLIANQLKGKVRVDAHHMPKGSLTMIGNGIMDTEPFTPAAASGGTGWYPYASMNNVRIDSDGGCVERFPNEVGRVVNGVRRPLMSTGGDGDWLYAERLRLGGGELAVIGGALTWTRPDGTTYTVDA